MTNYMVEGLMKKRAELHGELKRTQEDMARMARELETLDATLKIVAPDLDIPAIAPKMVKPPADWSHRGEMGRLCLDILRQAGKPLTSREIAAELIVRRGLTATPQLLNLMVKRVGGCLRDRRDQGLVENAPTRGGITLEWQLVR